MSSNRSRAALDTPERAIERKALIKALFSVSIRVKQLAIDESYL